MRASIPVFNQSRPDAAATVVLFDESTQVGPTLFQRGMRQLTAMIYNDQSLTLNVYQKPKRTSGAWSLVSTAALAASSSTVNNQESFDLTGMTGVLKMEVVGGASPCTQYFVMIEANDNVESGGCAA